MPYQQPKPIDCVLHSVLAERASQGVQWLDRNVPGWDAWVDLDALNMFSMEHDVLSQACKEPYALACRHHKLTRPKQIALGFWIETGDARLPGESWESAWTRVKGAYHDLNNIWHDIIRYRQQPWRLRPPQFDCSVPPRAPSRGGFTPQQEEWGDAACDQAREV